LSGVTVTWSPVSGATSYDLLVDGVTTLIGVASPYTYLPGDTSSHNYQVRASTCWAGGWSDLGLGIDQAQTPPSVGTLSMQKFGTDLLISWVPMGDPTLVDYYQVMRSLNPAGPFDTSVGTATGIVHGLYLSLAGEPTTAYYKVRGVKGNCLGPLD
jgi:hypothetical protein